MAQSVSNDALWEKLSEIEKKLNQLAEIQRALLPQQEQVEIKPDFKGVKDDILAEIKTDIRILGLSNDSHFTANTKNVELLEKHIMTVSKQVASFRKESQSLSESQKTLIELQRESGRETYLDFGIFRVGKTTFILVLLVLLVFILFRVC